MQTGYLTQSSKVLVYLLMKWPDKFLTENRSEEESYEYSTGSTGKTRGKEQ